MRILTGLAMASAIGLSPAAAQADTISYSAFYPNGAETPQSSGFAPTDWDGSTQTVTLPQFDATRGTLTGVDFTLTGEINASGSLTNSGAATYSSQGYDVLLTMRLLQPGTAPDGISLVEAAPVLVSLGTQDVTPGQSISFGAPTLVDSIVTGSAGLTTGLDPYIGAGSLLFPLVTAIATNASSANSSGSLDLAQSTVAKALVSITYTYDLAATDVPEPASLALLGMGLLGLGLLGLLRRRS